jgi:Zn-dependent protease with chaperone function/Tfp pilus assembly protein PilF
VGALAVTGLACVCARADDDNWSPKDRTAEQSANQLMDEGRYAAAERAYRHLLERHPGSSRALVLHVQALEGLNRFDAALEESRRAVEINPNNAQAQAWYGAGLSRTGQYGLAVQALYTALALNPGDPQATTVLAVFYVRTGRRDLAGPLLAGLLKDRDEDDQLDMMTRIADAFYRAGDEQDAVAWWLKSAKAGNKTAARWLAWAYSNGYGVPVDNGENAYWTRRGDDPYPWFPRLAFSDALIGETGGWVLVVVALLAASVLPFLTLLPIGLCCSWGQTTDPAVHWSERARRSFPFKAFLGFCLLVLPVLYAANALYYPGSQLPVSRWLLFWVVLLVGMLSVNRVVVFLARRYQAQPDTALQNLQNIAVTYFIYAPVFVIFIIMSMALPSTWNAQAVLVLGGGVLAYFWLQFGGWVRLGRLLRLVYPAGPELTGAAGEVARQLGCSEPAVWMFRWRKANAFAFIFSNAILVTEKLHGLLDPDEMKSVLAHEMAHLCEDRVTQAMRLLVPLLLLPLFSLQLWWSDNGWYELSGFYIFLLLGVFLLRKRRRRMEERADTFGNKAAVAEGIYPRALAKIYEDNLVPAVMPGKRMVYPHLYDRMLAAGMTPDYPRPKPPLRWGIWPGLVVCLLNLGIVGALWLLLF